MADVPYRFLKRFCTQNQVIREFMAEFLGTFVFILIGDAAIAQAVLEDKKVDDVFAIVWGWGVGVMMGLATSGSISGGHINPAVTVAFATLSKFPWKKVGYYLLAQHLGAFIASSVIFVTYKDALDHFDPNRTVTGERATALIWTTFPKEYVSLSNCFLDQVVGTSLMMFTVLACVDAKNIKIPSWFHPIIIGFIVSGLGVCFSSNCMGPLNPARDFATRCFTAIAGYGLEVFTFSIQVLLLFFYWLIITPPILWERFRHFWWIGIIGPHVGAIVGGWIYYLGIELHLPGTQGYVKKEEG